MFCCRNRRICTKQLHSQDVYKMFCCRNRRICTKQLHSQDVYKMFCCRNRRICTQNVLLSQSQDMYTKCFVVVIAGYAYTLFCCHNRRIRTQNVLLSQLQDMYTKCFCWHTFSHFCFTHSVTHTRTIKKSNSRTSKFKIMA